MALKPIFGTGAGANGFGEKHVFNEFFYSFGDDTIAVEGLQIFTYAQH